MLRDRLTLLGREAARIVLPSWCVVCGTDLPWTRRKDSCCLDCWQDLPRIRVAKCSSCALPLPSAANGERCIECQVHPLPIAWGDAWGHYRGSMEKLLGAFKFARHDFLADALAALLEETVRARGDIHFDAVTTVPMHRAKLRRRGFNQSELLSRALARRLNLRFLPLLRKRSERQAQSSLRRDARAANVRGVFEARGGDGLSVLLVDDVCTTGETIRECASVLGDAGAARVCAVTVAKAGS